jgi:Family of unknown function (DUF6338)
MPEHLTYEALAALLILLPGFLTAEFIGVLSARPDRTEFDKVVQALSYCLVNYTVFAALRGKFPLAVRVETVGGAERYSLEIQPWPLVELLVIAIVLAVIVAYAINKDSLSWLRDAGITQRTFRVSVWNDTFHTFSGFVQVELSDGRHVIGYLRFYSDTADESSLFLEDAAWLREDGEQFPIDGAGILLTKESGIRAVLFLKPDPSSSDPLGYQEV